MNRGSSKRLIGRYFCTAVTIPLERPENSEANLGAIQVELRFDRRRSESLETMTYVIFTPAISKAQDFFHHF